MTTTILSGLDATTALARLSIKRTLRGKSVWLAVGLSLLPCLLALAWRAQHGDDSTPADIWDNLIVTFSMVQTVVAPILVASSLSDEIDDRTAAYLWSRALPRWSVVTGKLLGLVPIVAGASTLGLAVCWLVVGGPPAVPASDLARAVLAFTAGAIGCGAVSALIATLAPRFAVPIAVGWLLLFDAPVGGLDFGLRAITVTFGTRAIARGSDDLLGPISLAVIMVVCLMIAIRRVDRIE